MRLQSIGETFFIPKDVQQCLWSICAYASALLFVEGLVKSIQFCWLTYTSLIKEFQSMFFFSCRFSCAKKCSNEGRALMQLDFRHFVMKLERIAEMKPLPHQEYVTNYIKAFYIPESELEEWIKIHTVSDISCIKKFFAISLMYEQRTLGFIIKSFFFVSKESVKIKKVSLAHLLLLHTCNECLHGNVRF